MTEKFFDVDFLSQNDAAKVLISGIERRSITAFNTNDLSLSGSNDFTSLFDSAALDRGASFLERAKALSPNFVKEGLSGFSLRTVHNSLYSWTGSSRPPINLQLIFIATRRGDDVRKPTVAIMKSVLPTAIDIEGALTLVAPLGYQASGNLTASGVVAIKMGNWFQATNLIVRSAEFTYSKEVTSNGTPLFATGSMTLEPFRVITYEEYRSWFIGV